MRDQGESLDQLPEAIRLVIWDLDETFWQGTRTEGGITAYSEQNHQTVIELAARGIMSSICSKNSHEDIREILTNKGIWQYFIFPSIDWTPKPERIAAIVEAVQLRPATILFVDDNANNRAAVASRIPGIQVASEEVLPSLLSHPRFAGKDDKSLTRLTQYKLLETRAGDQSRADDNTEFLRNSGIEVEIDMDVEKHYPRIVELINRTNQLNFTKVRLPEDETAAVDELKRQIDSAGTYASQAALVRVRDNYGDYGYCGFFLLRWGTLVHYCFSCRILGFGVEQYLYKKLLSPPIEIRGDVLSDLHDRTEVDWINVARLGVDNESSTEVQAFSSAIDSVGIRAECETGMLAHYFNFVADKLYVEGQESNGILTFAGDSLVNANFLSSSSLDVAKSELLALGFSAEAKSTLLDRQARLNILMSGRDFPHFVYRHQSKSFAINVFLRGYWGNLCEDGQEFIEAHVLAEFPDVQERARALQSMNYLRGNFATVPFGSAEFEELQRVSLQNAANAIRDDGLLFVVLKHPKVRWPSGEVKEWDRLVAHRRFIQTEAAKNPRVVVVDISECVESDDEILDTVHYERIVYFRLYRRIAHRYSELAKAA